MNINKQIDNDIEIISGMIANSTYFFDNLEILVTQLDQDKKVIFNGYPFLKRTKITLWSLVLLDIYKILSNRDKDKFRFISVLSRIENNYKNVHWEHVLTKKEINELKHLIIAEAENIEKIVHIRDTRIAHYDDNVDVKVLKIDELKRLVLLCQDICNKLTYSLFNSTTTWTFSSSEMVFPVVNSLTRFQKVRDLVFKSRVDQTATIETEVLMKIIRANR